jgi:hypothetical protein
LSAALYRIKTRVPREKGLNFAYRKKLMIEQIDQPKCNSFYFFKYRYFIPSAEHRN